MLRSASVAVLFLVVLLVVLLVTGLFQFASRVSAETSKEWLVTSNADSGQGTLRWAIEGANDSSVDDVIRFGGAMTIRPLSALPALSDEDISVIGSSGDASPDVAPQVWIDGDRAGDAAGLELIAAGGLVRGIGIFGFERYGIGVIGVEASRARIEGNWIGLRPDGAASANRLSGVAVIGGASGARVTDNRIGGNSVRERTGHGVVVRWWWQCRGCPVWQHHRHRPRWFVIAQRRRNTGCGFGASNNSRQHDRQQQGGGD